LTPDESRLVAQVSQSEHISEAALMKRFVLEGLQRYRLDRAVQLYQRGETDLSGAARYAGVSVQRMMHTLRERGWNMALRPRISWTDWRFWHETSMTMSSKKS